MQGTEPENDSTIRLPVHEQRETFPSWKRGIMTVNGVAFSQTGEVLFLQPKKENDDVREVRTEDGRSDAS